MDEFVASNGYRVWIDRGVVQSAPSSGVVPSSEHNRLATDALREFFLHERDEQLGGWRWPECPEFVVYPTDDERDSVRVLNETEMGMYWFDRTSALYAVQGEIPRYRRAAIAYFAAHPKTKPWFEAAEGELWELDGNRYIVVHDSDGVTSAGPRFFPVPPSHSGDLGWTPGRFGTEFTSGRRLWPEVSDAD